MNVKSLACLEKLLRHFKNEKWLKPISDFALYIGFPALIFTNLTHSTLNFNLVSHSFQLVSFLLLGMLILILTGLKFFKSSRNKKATYIICFLFGNAAFLGIPIITTLAPKLAKTASVNAAIMLFWVFSLGLIIVEYLTLNKPKIKQITINLFKNPLLLSVIFGLGFNYLQIPTPKIIARCNVVLRKSAQLSLDANTLYYIDFDLAKI